MQDFIFNTFPEIRDLLLRNFYLSEYLLFRLEMMKNLIFDLKNRGSTFMQVRLIHE